MNTAAPSRLPAPNGRTLPSSWNGGTSTLPNSPPALCRSCCATPLATTCVRHGHWKWMDGVTRSASWQVICPFWWRPTHWGWTTPTPAWPSKAAAAAARPLSRPCRNCSMPANRCCGASSATAGSCGCCVMPRRLPARVFWKSTWSTCWAANTTPSLPMHGGCCMPAGHLQIPRIRPASGNDGATRVNRKVPGYGMACATASKRHCSRWVRVFCSIHPTTTCVLRWTVVNWVATPTSSNCCGWCTG